MNSKVSYAVAAILSGVSFTAHAADAEGGLEEITVTAQRRNESIQNVPIAMQAFTAESLQQLNVSTLDDYIKYLPNVTTANNGPGQNEVFMRGLSAGSQPSQGSASTGLWPNVAIYLDNQSGQLPNRNLDAGYQKLDAGFIKRRFFRRNAANLAYHLHLVVSPTWPIKNELLLRDWLIQHPEVARAYETLKVELAAIYGDDMPRYTTEKTSFLRRTVNDARLCQGLSIEEDWDE